MKCPRMPIVYEILLRRLVYRQNRSAIALRTDTFRLENAAPESAKRYAFDYRIERGVRRDNCVHTNVYFTRSRNYSIRTRPAIYIALIDMRSGFRHANLAAEI